MAEHYLFGGGWYRDLARARLRPPLPVGRSSLSAIKESPDGGFGQLAAGSAVSCRERLSEAGTRGVSIAKCLRTT